MKRYALIIVLCLGSILVKGQDEIEVVLNYMPALSLGQTADFTRNLSPRGVELEMHRFISEELSLGLAVGWNVFREKVVGESFEYKEYLVTGTQFRYTNIVPLNAVFRKYFGTGDYIPFIGIGLGTSYAKQTRDAGIFSLVDNKWQFHFAPEAGTQLRVSSGMMVSLKIKYNYSVKSGNFPSMSFLGLGVGLGMY